MFLLPTTYYLLDSVMLSRQSLDADARSRAFTVDRLRKIGLDCGRCGEQQMTDALATVSGTIRGNLGGSRVPDFEVQAK